MTTYMYFADLYDVKNAYYTDLFMRALATQITFAQINYIINCMVD